MMRLTEVHWITTAQREVLAKHRIVTLGELASFELADSMADVVPVDNLRALARRARQALGQSDPLEQLGAAAGQRPGTPVAYAGGVRFEGTNNG